MPVPEFEALEREYHARGFLFVAGVDEAGRGPLAGPLSVGLTVFHPDFFQSDLPESLNGLTDSKKLSPARRLKFRTAIERAALTGVVVHVSNRLVDRLGISGATEFAVIRALHRACLALGRLPDALLMDGNYKLPQVRRAFPKLAYQAVVKGDSRVLSIAAASILAKTRRDARMEKFGALIPGYQLEKHKGYGTRAHCESIVERGLSPLHRRSYTRGILEKARATGATREV